MKKKLINNSISINATILACILICVCIANKVRSQSLNIKNDVFWNTKDGRPIYSQGGGIFKFKDATGREKYYWYGVQYKEAAIYRNDPL
jgi:hypothetical protein